MKLGNFALTLVIAGIGGWIFQSLGLPLPWMLGALTSVTLSAILQVPVHAPARVRAPMTAIIGVLLGAGFHPDLVGQILAWVPSFVGLFVFTIVAGFACTAYLFWIARLDKVTAYFSGMPGGLVEMIEVGRERGGDEMTIALMHSARILLVVMTVPFLVQLIEGVSIADAPPVGEPIRNASVSTFLQLAGCAVLGVVLGRLFKLPAKDLLGPMLVSAALHITGVTTFVPPTEVVNGAQLVLGAVLGSRFSAAKPQDILRILGIAFGMAAVLITVVSLTALAMSHLTGQGPATFILAYSPGGLTEMGLVALAIQADIAFVASHHLVRVLFVMLCAGPVFTLLEKLGARTPNPKSDP